MWTAVALPAKPPVGRFALHRRSAALSFGEVSELCRTDAAFRAFLTGALSGSPLEAFFWEVAPVACQTLGHPFECVLVPAPALGRLQPDAAPFRSHFAAQPTTDVLSFPNLGGDAVLIVPAPRADAACYTHLGCFLRTAPHPQVDTFWQQVGTTLRERLSAQPIWLSTAGLGVSWLHLRLDSRPKYYRYQPYRTADLLGRQDKL